ncbi:MAG TPA: DUF3618 domain-containing protein [Bryobacteraceae bacterium]
MGEKPDQIREEIEQARYRLGQNLNQLEYRVRQTTDWRVQFDRHPWVFAGAAFTGALVFGWMIGHPRRAWETDRRDYFRSAPAGRV